MSKINNEWPAIEMHKMISDISGIRIAVLQALQLITLQIAHI